MPPSVWTVSDLSQAILETLTTQFPNPIWVTGEVSNLSRAPSGHIYFTLKDDAAAISCTLWRSRAQRVTLPKNGDAIEVLGTLTTYAPRGTYQLDVQTLRAAGAGAWYQRFLEVKAKLEAEGLFAPERKRPLPRYPRRIAIVTSPQADALQDVLRTLANRAPMIEAVLFPTLVQGKEAPQAIAAALRWVGQAHQALKLELVLLVRGGGAAEDLAAFNDEGVARAIAACPIPVVSGVGHETDTTIADFVADLRAPTPTGAATAVSQGWSEAIGTLEQLQTRLHRAFAQHWQEAVQQMDERERNLLHLSPRSLLRDALHRLDHARSRMSEALSMTLRTRARELEAVAQQLRHPRAQLAAQREALTQLERRMPHPLALLAPFGRQLTHWDERLTRHPPNLSAPRERLAALDAQLKALSPLAVLDRGYTLVFDPSGKVVTRVADLAPQEAIRICFADGTADAHVATIAKTE